MCVRAHTPGSVRVCGVREIQYYDHAIIFKILMYTFLLILLKRGVLTLVGEKRRYRNGRYCYYNHYNLTCYNKTCSQNTTDFP